MKSRQKLSVSERNILQRHLQEADNYPELRINKKISSNLLLQKNINFLKAYNNIFRRPSYDHIGDANSYFKQSLRNEPFDLIRDLHLNNSVRSARSFESLNQNTTRRPRSRRTVLLPKKISECPIKSEVKAQKLDQEEFRLKELFTPDIKETESDSDSADIEYFSPEATNFFSPHEKTEQNTEQEENLEQETITVQEISETQAEQVQPDIDNISDRLDNILKGVFEEDDNEGKEMGEEYYEDEYEDEVEEFAGFGEEDDDMKEVEKMIERASKELEEVAGENQKIMESLEEGDEDKETFKYNPAIDSTLLRELEEAECQAKETAKIITELKERVMELSKKETMTEAEAKELEQKNLELKKQMLIFEEKTKRIQELLAQANLFENLGTFKPSTYNEDVLPKVVVCGITENQMPKILICEDNATCKSRRKKRKSKSRSRSRSRTPSVTCTCPVGPGINNEGQQMQQISQQMMPQQMPQQMIPQQMMPQQMMPQQMMPQQMMPQQMMPQQMMPQQMMPEMMPATTCECHQQELPQGQRMTQSMMSQPQMGGNQIPQMITSQFPQMMIPPMEASDYCQCDEKTKNSTKSRGQTGRSRSTSKETNMPCGKGKGICPAEIESRLQEYSENTQFLERQLCDMESEVKEMHQELMAVQKEREHLELHRKSLCPPPCTPPCGPPPCCIPPPCGSVCETQLRELREQYKRLQDDFKSKLTEVAGLRTENEKLKDRTKQAEDIKKEAEKQVRDLELEIKRIKGTLKAPKQISKEQVIELEQQLNVAKQRFREAQDELDELRLLVEDQQKQLDDYRNKYLEAQQQVEEQRRQIDLMEMENQRISEQVNLEIQRVKNQFQEKLQELMPLPDILKSTQMKLQEAQQMHLLAERNNESIARELQMYKDKIAAMSSQIDEVRSDQQFGEDAKVGLESKVQELEEQLNELQELNANLLEDLQKFTEKCDEYEKLSDERLHEIVQLEAQLETLREETARQVARIKDRCEIVRRSMQNQISDLERQLAQSRALAKSAQKDRDEIRQKMQAQINNLNENFEDAQMRIRNLQGHVNFLRNSYGDVYGGDNTACRPPVMPDPCDCNPAY